MASNFSDPFSVHALKVHSKDKKASRWLFVDDSGQMTMGDVNEDKTIIPSLQKNAFNYSLASPAVTTDYPLSTTSYVGLRLVFDANLGSNTTLTSLKGSTVENVVSSGEYLSFSYRNNTLLEKLEITSYSADNQRWKKIHLEFVLTTTLDTPSSWFTSPPITQGLQYTNLQMNFVRPVVSLGSVSSFGIISNVSVVDGKVQFNYMPPNSSTDSIAFDAVYDGTTTNESAVSFPVTGLLPSPTFESWAEAPTSQSYAYTNLTVQFSKEITTCTSISASAGSPPSNIRIVGGHVVFDWTSPASSSVILSFLGLQATDGTLDAGAIESANLTLAAPPNSPAWFSNQPVNASTSYNPEVSFNKSILSVGSVTSSGTNQPTNISVISGRIRFDITSDANPSVVYTFNDVRSVDGGRKKSLTLTTGPSLTQVLTDKGGFVASSDVLSGYTTKHRFVFSKSLAGVPTGSFLSGEGTFDISPTLVTTLLANDTVQLDITASATTSSITFGLITAVDTTITQNVSSSLTVKPALSFNFISESTGPLVSKTTFDVNTEYDMKANFGAPPGLSVDFSGVTMSCDAATVGAITSVSENNYVFKLKPTSASTTAKLNILNARDFNAFIYPLFMTGNLTFNPIVPAPSYYLDASDESAFTYDATTKAITSINQSSTGLTFQKIAGSWKANYLNGKGVIDFLGFTDKSLVASDMSSTFSSGSWTISYLVKAFQTGGAYTVGTQMTGGTARIDSFASTKTWRGMIPFTLNNIPTEANSRYIVIGDWYLFTVTRLNSGDTSYYVNDQFIGRAGQGNMGNLQFFILNGFHAGVSAGSQTAFAEVRLYTSGMDNAEVGALYQTVKTKWGL